MTKAVLAKYNCWLTGTKKTKNSSGRGWKSFGLVEAKEATISETVEAGEEILLHSGHQHSDGESVQSDRLPVQQKKSCPIHAAFPQGKL